MVAEAIGKEGGMSAANLKVAELYISAFGNLAKTNNTLIIPSNVSDVAGLVASAMGRSGMTVFGNVRSLASSRIRKPSGASRAVSSVCGTIPSN